MKSILFQTILLFKTITLINARAAINGTLYYSISLDKDYDYELALTSNDHDPFMEFWWKTEEIDASADHHTRHGSSSSGSSNLQKKYTCRFIHKTSTTDGSNDAPAWIGFGVQDVSKVNGNGRDQMVGAETLIGFADPDGGEGYAKTYAMNGLYEGRGGVEETSVNNIYDLSKSKVIQIESEGQDGLDSVTTIFEFVMIVDDDHGNNDGITRHGEDDNNDSFFRAKGENFFIYGIGPPLSSSFSSDKIGKHVKAGSFVIDFDKVGTSTERTYVNKPSNCKSDDADYELMIVLQHNVKFYWTLDGVNDLLHVQMKHLGQAWLGWGIAEDAEGKMIDANAVIGRPALTAANDDLPLKYFMSRKEQSGVYPLAHDKQTLTNASLTQSDEETILRFTKPLDEVDENRISKTDVTTIIFAVGEGNIMTRHQFSDHFSIELDKCPLDVHEFIEEDSYQTAWIFHGVFGTLAFALLMPLSISSAFLRQLLPTSWIFCHAYGNLLAVSFTLISVFIATLTFSSSGAAHFTEPHHKIGLSLLILAVIQMISGLLRPNPYHEKARNVWKIFHGVLGIVILGLGFYQVGDGLEMYSVDYETVDLGPLYFVFLAVFGIVIMGAKLWLYVHGVEERKFVDDNDDDCDAEIETLQLRKLDPPEAELT